jgi:hypothetical protein
MTRSGAPSGESRPTRSPAARPPGVHPGGITPAVWGGDDVACAVSGHVTGRSVPRRALIVSMHSTGTIIIS